MRLSQRLRELVGRGESTEETPPPPATAPTLAPNPTPTPPPAPVISLTVESAYAMLQAFPKDTQDSQRISGLRTALIVTASEKNKSLQQLLTDVLHEKARIHLALQNQEKTHEAQLTEITEAVDALWDKRDKLTEHHQRLTIQAQERMEGLDQLIQCLSIVDEPVIEISSVPKAPVVREADEGPVVLRMRTTPDTNAQPENIERTVNPRRLSSR